MTVVPLPVKAPAGYRMHARGARGEVYLYGPIGQSWFGDGVTAKQFAADLKALGGVTAIDLRINSEGGSVADAEAMYTHLIEHKARVTSHIDGLAASAASFVAMAGEEILIADSGFIMIHEARIQQYGTSDDFRRMADLLERATDRIADKYARRTKNSDKKIREWMKDETWFVGKEAVDNGFADRVVENLKIAATVADPARYHNLPAALAPNSVRAMAAFARIAAVMR